MRDADAVQVMQVHIIHALCEGAVMSIQFRDGPFAAVRTVELDRLVDSLNDLVSSGRPGRRRNYRRQGKQKHHSCDTYALKHDNSHRRPVPKAAANHSRWTT